MKINLSVVTENEPFQIKGDNRFFKKLKLDGGIIAFYVYAYNPDARVWRLDYSQARYLAEMNRIKILSSKIIHIVDDVMFCNSYVRNEHKNNYAISFLQKGKRYIAEATINHVVDDKISYFMTRTSSAGADNTHPDMPSYAPEMACKRAAIKCIIDCLGLEDIVEEFYGFKEIDETEKEAQPIMTPATNNKEESIPTEMISDLQIEQLKILDPKFKQEKYDGKTAEQAGKIILKLRNKSVKKTKRNKNKK